MFIGAAAVVLLVCCVLPLVSMVALSLESSDTSLLLDRRQRALLFNTAMLGGVTALLATLVGAPLGVALARVDLRWKTMLRVALAMPMLLPPYVAALAWVSLGGSSGLVTRIAGRDILSDRTHSIVGAVLVLTSVLYPLSMLATEVAVRRIEARLEEAALLVTTPHRVLWRITLPLAAPSITATALVIFVLAVSDFGVPGLLRVRVFTTEVFAAFAALYDFGRATVLALPLLLLSSAVAVLAIRRAGDRTIVTRRGTAGAQPLTFIEWKPALLVVATLVTALSLVLPLAALALEALGDRSWMATLEGSGAAIVNSLVQATIGATLTVVTGLWLGYARARGPRRAGRAADVLLVVLFAVPSTVIGVGLIGLWNRPGVFGAIYGTDIMLLLVCLGRFLPVASLASAAMVRHVPISHEEAAATAGARWARTMWRIVVPQAATGLAAIWVVVFVLAFGELGASILVAPPGETTLPIRIYTLIANAPPAQVAALALLQTAVILAAPLLLAGVVAVREAR